MENTIKKIVSSFLVLLMLTGCMTIRAEDEEPTSAEPIVETEDGQDEEPLVFNENQDSYQDESFIDDETLIIEDEESAQEDLEPQEEAEMPGEDEIPEEDDIYVVEPGEDSTIKADDPVYVFNEEVEIDGVLINVSAEEGVFPEDAILSVKKVEYHEEEVEIGPEEAPETDQESGEEISPQLEEVLNREVDNEAVEAIEQAVSEARNEDKNVAISYTYDIKVLDSEGNEIEPNGPVSVKFSLVQKMQEALNVDVYHIDDELNVEALETTVSENETEEDLNTDVEVETESFSYYTVEFTYNNLQYVLDGDSEVELSAILETLGINGEVSGAEVSDSELFDVYEEDGVWYAAAL